MSIRSTRTSLTCSSCEASVAVPEEGDWRELWDAGWRWRGAPEPAGAAKFVPREFLFSCPACPQVI